MASDSAPRSMQGKGALVTGAAQGLGKAITETLLKHGARVCLLDIQGDKGAETARTFQVTYGKDSATFIKCDVTDPSQFTDAFAQAKNVMGALDIVVNNAGILHEQQWEKMLAINLSAMIRGTYLAVEHMSRDKGGQGGVVINMASEAGLIIVPQCPSYIASKHGVVGFSSAIGENSIFTKQGIRVNSLCPGVTDTDILNWTEEQVWGKEVLDKFKDAGVLPVSAVTEAFMSLLDDPSLSGAVLAILLKGREMVRSGIKITNDK